MPPSIVCAMDVISTVLSTGVWILGLLLMLLMAVLPWFTQFWDGR